MIDKTKYLEGKWDVESFGEVPIPRQLEFKIGDRGSMWVEMSNKTNEDRKYFYEVLGPFIQNLAKYHHIRLWDNQVVSNDYVGQFVNGRLIPHMKEWLMTYNVGWRYGNWG